MSGRLDTLKQRLGLRLAEAETEDDARRARSIDKDRPTAVLIAIDRRARKWGPRWLERSGFGVLEAGSAAESAAVLEDIEPSLVIVEASLRDDRGKPLYERHVEELSGRVPVIVITATEQEARRALAVGAVDIVRRAADWQLSSRRAAFIVQSQNAHSELERARASLDRALKFADKAEKQLERKTAADALTNLPDARVLERLLSKALASPRPAGAVTALLSVGLDGLGAINETFGRQRGDALLAAVAEQLTDCLRAEALVAVRAPGLLSAVATRTGGDRFALMVSNIAGLDALAKLAEYVRHRLAESFEIGGETIYVSASIGAACSPDHAETAEELIRHAELAMSQAKTLGGNRISCYSSALNEQAQRRAVIGRDLRLAVEREEFLLHYQPLVDARKGHLVAVEALLRWVHPRRGLIGPAEFITVAEELSLMVPIGRWVLRTACRQLRQWMDDGLDGVRIAVNVAVCQISRGDLVEDVEMALRESGVPAQLLELEISERGILNKEPGSQNVLRRLKDLGVRISVDDFGTGDSAIAYLKSVPLDVLKVDRQYVSSASADNDDFVIASAMVAMAHRLQLTVVAEGVETEEQAALARDWGCDELQGYLFSKPVEPAEIPGLSKQFEK